MTTPLYHAIGLTLIMMSIYLGCKLVLTRKFDPENTLRLIEKERVTHSCFVPTQYSMMTQLQGRERFNMGSLKTLISGAAPFPKKIKEEALRYFECNIFEFYGLTETAIITSLRPEDQLRKIGSVGKPALNVEIRLIDEKGNFLPKGEIGEIVTRTPFMMKEYYNNEEQTKQSYLLEEWFKTGDMGRVDEEGFLYIVDRKKDIIISGGVNIHPSDIEFTLYEHPAVLECAVVGMPDEIWGEAVSAFVVLKDGMAVSENELHRFISDRLAGYQKPQKITIVDTPPKNPSGKILKRELVDHRVSNPFTGEENSSLKAKR